MCGYGAIRWSKLNLPGMTPPVKTNCPSLHSHHLLTAPQLGGGGGGGGEVLKGPLPTYAGMLTDFRFDIVNVCFVCLVDHVLCQKDNHEKGSSWWWWLVAC